MNLKLLQTWISSCCIGYGFAAFAYKARTRVMVTSTDLSFYFELLAGDLSLKQNCGLLILTNEFCTSANEPLNSNLTCMSPVKHVIQ